MKPLFKFYEVVKVVSDEPRYESINGLTGFIDGMAHNDEGDWSYAVFIFEQEVGWSLMESDIISTGKFVDEEDFMSDESIRVAVNPKTGRGEIKE